MRILAFVCAAAGFAVGGLAVLRAQVAGEPSPGDVAPAFSLPGSDGQTYSLSQFRGKQAVVIAWFPKAFTGG